METENNSQFKNGFSLIEFVVVVGIISMILAMVLVNYRSGERQYLLETTAQQLMADLRRAQNMAISSAEFQSVIPDGYGIHFDALSQSYILFADLDENNIYNLSSEEIETVVLPEKVVISSLFPPSSFDVIFIPPDPKTEITPDPGVEPAKVVLGIQGDSRTKSVTITKGGVIEIE